VSGVDAGQAGPAQGEDLAHGTLGGTIGRGHRIEAAGPFGVIPLVLGFQVARAKMRQRGGAGAVGESVRQLGQLSEAGIGQQGQTSSPARCVSRK